MMIGLASAWYLVACAPQDAAPSTAEPPTPDVSPTVTIATQVANVTPGTAPPFQTVTPVPTRTLTLPPQPSVTPTLAQSLSPIQQTEIFVYSQLTAEVNTATALAPPTNTPTPTPSHTPTLTPTPIVPDAIANTILFSSTRAGSHDLWLMGLDGSDVAPLVIRPGSDEFSADCSPDGRAFVFDSDRTGDREIYLGGFAGEQPRPLTDTSGENYAPRWSPTTDQIAFVSTRDGAADIWLMDSGGGNVRQLTTDPGTDHMPSWSPDGSRILFASDRDGGFDIYAYDLASETVTRLLETPERDESHPLLSLDGERLLFIARTDPQDRATNALFAQSSGGATPEYTFGAVGGVNTPALIAENYVLLSADLGGVTHILAANLRNQRQTILTNLGPGNHNPRPCNVLTRTATADLPLGMLATLTPLPTLDRATVYTPVVNPGADWRIESVFLTRDTLARAGENDARLPGPRVTLTPLFMVYRWEDAAGNAHALTLAPEIREGELAIRPVRYTVNNLDADINAADDRLFLIREHILASSIPPGAYHLAAINLTDDTLQLDIAIPPHE